jgi:hypothetical protein
MEGVPLQAVSIQQKWPPASKILDTEGHLIDLAHPADQAYPLTGLTRPRLTR